MDHAQQGSRRTALREFHVARAARERYQFDRSLYGYTGNIVFADLQAVRDFVQAINRNRDATAHPESTARVAHINAMGLIDEACHVVVRWYLNAHGKDLFDRCLVNASERLGTPDVNRILETFVREFPPRDVYSGEQSGSEYLTEDHEGESGRSLALEELLMLWVANQNHAFQGYAELVGDSSIRRDTRYPELIEGLAGFFRGLPGIGESGTSFVDFLLEPARLYPDSLEDQLRFIQSKWGPILGDFLHRLLRALDLLKEENKRFVAPPGPAVARVYEFGGMDQEIERFSPDQDWMPNVVLMAKSTLVWLDQLSKTYAREIRRLDQIPDEELDVLQRAGFTGLWLIGLWERSKASKRIKQMTGNPEAEASAYSLLEYRIADELGGQPALENLRERCRVRGIRLASDMVPNHTGIDGRWVEEHPEWYVQVPQPPFSGYTFSGITLSNNPDIGIYLEDHYFDRTDAAVVFKRVDFRTGDTRYIYHGNDGTHMPWNDTAQLNFLNSRTREAVIQTILEVARNFRIIRFDAAMTLAKKHVQRLWYPEPGAGGDIPSRSEHGMTREEFDAAMPQEFWREVVDRVATEVPDTLLLAEAFWMMEGFFVRTLGMHRVYNSAFMHMMKNEDNAKYRQLIRNTIEFDKEILKRYVNFMNNPDEETAVAQFGKGDKYFGVCTMMVTMPGLPMFGHGQVEGFSEKYGMEYRRAYHDEAPDRELIERHQREIFPLVRRRYLFAHVDAFHLFDLYREDGGVNENVFAFSNCFRQDCALVLYNNAYESASGWIRTSAGFVEKTKNGAKPLRRRDLADALGLNRSRAHFCLMREQRSGLWFIRNSAEVRERGLHISLAGYQSQVFLDIREVADNDYGHYRQLAEKADGNGIPDIERALREVYLRPLHESFDRFLTPDTCRTLVEYVAGRRILEPKEEISLVKEYEKFVRDAAEFGAFDTGADEAVEEFSRLLKAAGAMQLRNGVPQEELTSVHRKSVEQPEALASTLTWLMVSPLGALPPDLRAETTLDAHRRRSHIAAAARATMDEWMLADRIASALRAADSEAQARTTVSLSRILVSHDRWYAVEGADPQKLLRDLCEDTDVRDFLNFNTFNGVVWFDREGFELFARGLQSVAVIRAHADTLARDGAAESHAVRPATTKGEQKVLAHVHETYEDWVAAAGKSEYRVDRLFELLSRTDGPLARAPDDV